MKPKYLVSACLIGEKCKYNGLDNLNNRLESFESLGILYPICPEVLGGLLVPRSPSEIINNSVYNSDGNDVTNEFNSGAKQVLEIAEKYNIRKAILKENSPSCGVDHVYDGSFDHTLINGSGITTKLLKDNGIEVYSEEYICDYDAIIVAAGNSSRNTLKYNKILEYSLNKSCIESSIYPFLTDYRCNKVIIVCNEKEIDIIKELTRNIRVEYVIGGNSREESVRNGLNKATSKYVLIHDGARPYIKDEEVDNILNNLKEYDCVVPYVYSSNTYDYQIDGKNIQTPQGYNTKLLKEVISKINDISKYRDESSFMSKYYEIKYIKGDINNTKLTDDNDIKKWREYNEDNL